MCCLHVVLGLAGVVALCWQWRRSPKIAALVIAALLGGFLVVKGAVTDNRWALWAHRAGVVVVGDTVAGEDAGAAGLGRDWRFWQLSCASAGMRIVFATRRPSR
jgi:hypothetical protein